jgi:hyperpolarization activated cyclic nucleotide-gated potassium channel 2
MSQEEEVTDNPLAATAGPGAGAFEVEGYEPNGPPSARSQLKDAKVAAVSKVRRGVGTSGGENVRDGSWHRHDNVMKGYNMGDASPNRPRTQVLPESVTELIELMPPVGDGASGKRSGKQLWDTLRAKLQVAMMFHMGIIPADSGVPPVGFSNIYQNRAPRTDWLDHARNAERQCEEKTLFFHPNSQLRLYWDLVQVFLLIYVAILVPIRAGFSIQTEPWGWKFMLDLLVDVYFVLDIAANFRTAYYEDKSGTLVVDQRKISMKYMKSWFVVDLMSCLPIVYIDMIMHCESFWSCTKGSSSDSNSFKMFKGLRLLRLAKMLRIARIKKIIERQDDAVGPLLQSFRLFGVLMLLFFTSHLFACLWYHVGEWDQLAPDGTVIQEGWVKQEEAAWAISLGYTADNVTQCEKWQTDTSGICIEWGARYIISIYWAMTTLSTVGFGDIHAHTSFEMVFAVMVEVCGGISFAILVGSLSSLLTTTSAASTIYHQKMDEVREFLRAKEIPRTERRQILAYYDHYWSEKTVFNEADILSNLPQNVQRDLIVRMYGDVVTNVPLFKALDDHTVAQICMMLRPIRVESNVNIVVQGEPSHEMYMLLQGEVSVSDGDELHGFLQPGAFFGELAVLVDTGLKDSMHYSMRTVKAVTDCDLLFLAKSDVHHVAVEHPELATALSSFARLRQKHAFDLGVDPKQLNELRKARKDLKGRGGLIGVDSSMSMRDLSATAGLTDKAKAPQRRQPTQAEISRQLRSLQASQQNALKRLESLTTDIERNMEAVDDLVDSMADVSR